MVRLQCLTYFANQKNCQPISIVSLSTYFTFYETIFSKPIHLKNSKKLNVFYAKRFCSTFYCIGVLQTFILYAGIDLRMELNGFVVEQFGSRLGINKKLKQKKCLEKIFEIKLQAGDDMSLFKSIQPVDS